MRIIVMLILCSAVSSSIQSSDYNPLPRHWSDTSPDVGTLEDKWKDQLTREWKEEAQVGKHYAFWGKQMAVVRKLTNPESYELRRVDVGDKDEMIAELESPPQYIDITTDQGKICRLEPRITLLIDNNVICYSITRTLGLCSTRWKSKHLLGLGQEEVISAFVLNIRGTRIAVAQNKNLSVYDDKGAQLLFRTLDDDITKITPDYEEPANTSHSSFYLESNSGEASYKVQACGKTRYEINSLQSE